MDKSQHTDGNEDTTNESASVACSNVRLWQLDTQKEWRIKHVLTPLSWDERAEKNYARFVDSRENK